MKANTVIEGDCLDVMGEFPSNCIDTIITDTPYALNSTKKTSTDRSSAGFMGMKWDNEIAFNPDVWREALRVSKPGATLLAFGGTRTHHRLMVAIEDAGWEIRDVIMWLYGQGYPKSHDVSKAIDKAKGAERETKRIKYSNNQLYKSGSQNTRPWLEIAEKNGYHELQGDIPVTPLAAKFSGYGSALKPSYEPIICAMKPLDGTYADNAERWGLGGLWIDGARVETNGEAIACHNGTGRGNALVGNVAENWGKPYQVGDANSSNTHTNGRWPANIIHDGSNEVEAEFAKAGVRKCSGAAKTGYKTLAKDKGFIGIGGNLHGYGTLHNDSGSASRFFYTAKASPSERGDYNNHPTVKPLALLKYLCRLTRPPDGGIVLDMFAGSGTTALACIAEGRDYILIEKEPEYIEIIRRRIAEYTGQEIAPKEVKLKDEQMVKQLGLW